MKRTIFRVASALWAAAALTGCMNFDYKGETFPEAETTKLYLSPAKAPAGYSVIGRAVVSGSYADLTREAMLRKLVDEGRLRGAEGVIVTGTQVVPGNRVVAVDPDVNTLSATSADTTYSWNSMISDFDGGYGEIGKKNAGQGRIPNYTRVIRAEFVRYGGTSAPSPTTSAAPVK